MSQLLAEHPPSIKRNGLDTAPRGQAPRRLWVIVRVAGHPREPQRGLRQHQGEHVRAVLEQRLPPRGRDALGHVRQVGPGLLRRVRDPGAAQHRVARRPDPAAGPGRRPAEAPGLLDDQDAQPEIRRGQRGRQAGRAAARHHHVELCRPGFHTRTRYSFASAPESGARAASSDGPRMYKTASTAAAASSTQARTLQKRRSPAGNTTIYGASIGAATITQPRTSAPPRARVRRAMAYQVTASPTRTPTLPSM